MTARGWVAAAAGLVLAVGAAGCRSSGSRAGSGDGGARDGGAASAGSRDAGPRLPEIAVLTGVAIRWTGKDRPPIGEEDLSRRLGAVLTSSPAFLAEGKPVPAGRVAVPAVVELTLHRDVLDAPANIKAKTPHVAAVAVEAEIDWKADSTRLRARENVIVQRPLERREMAGVDALLAKLVAEAVEEAGRGLVAKETLRQGDDGAVLAALGSDDADAALWALELTADRRIAAGFDRAVAMLDAPDPGVRAAALRALVALRDPRAVEPLARKADFADPDTMRALVEAVTAIGGPEAIAFLEMVAGGHADADMRQRAEEGLERLGRRQQRKSP